MLHIVLSGVPASFPRGQFFTATASVANTGGSAASGYSVRVTVDTASKPITITN